jgi:aurora kinase A
MLVALKTITKATIKKESCNEQLLREIKIQSYLQHVNIVRLYGTFSDKESVYLVLEYCPGGQLYDTFRLRSKMKEDEWAPIMKGIGEGLLALHKHGLLHRDLKPENVMISYGLPKIGDFGWAVHSPG